MKLHTIIFLALATTASADYVIYEESTGRIVRRDKTVEVRTDSAGEIIGEFASCRVLVASTTNDLNVTPIYTNISQIAITPITAKELKADYDGWQSVSKDSLIALVKVLLDEINILRDKAGLPPRTAAQLKAAIKEKLE